MEREKYAIYEYITPENAVDSIVWSTDNPEIAEVTVDSNGYASLVCYQVGDVVVTATSANNPSVSKSKTFTITSILDEATLKALITADSWSNIDTPEDVITFNEDGTGTITFIDLISYEQGTYDFNWQFSEYSDTEGLLIAFTTMIGEYDACFCILSLDGTTLAVEFYHQDSSLWYYQYKGNFAQAK